MEIPGLELLLTSISGSFKDRLDALVAAIHWFLIKEELKCKRDQDGKLSELLPSNWNADPNNYTLTYSGGGNIFVLNVLRMDQAALIHVTQEGKDRVAALNLSISDTVSENFTDYDRTFTNLEEFYSKFKSEVSPLIHPSSAKGAPNHSTSQTEEPRNDPPPRRAPNPDRIGTIQPDPFNIGVGDLDPLRAGRPGGGGGMIFDPFRGQRGGGGFPGHPGAGLPGGRLPPGAIPPGARFDPFGPDLEGDMRGPFRRGPGPDHMRPPGWDDQFM